jgi:hypothetical protein
VQLYSVRTLPSAPVMWLIFVAASGNRNYIAVGCPTGLYVAVRGESPFRKVLPIPLPSSIVPLQRFNKFLIQSDNSLFSYSLDLLARVARGESYVGTLEASKETIAGPGGDGNVLFFKVGVIETRTLGKSTFLRNRIWHLLSDASYICYKKFLASHPTHLGGYKSYRAE